MFLGSYEVHMDRHGGIIVPKKFREQLTGDSANKLIVTNFYIAEGLRCLDVYPIPAWEAFREPYDRLPIFVPRLIAFQNYYVGGAYECTLNRRGRLAISVNLRRYAKLTGEIVLSAAHTKFRIWNREIWNKAFTEAEHVMIGARTGHEDDNIP